jgi:MFS transporter, DHA1 family, quinolone resistance protein
MSTAVDDTRNLHLIKWLTCLMFLMFAMTTDAVGSVIPQVIQEFGLSMKEAGAFHYVPMGAIALGAIVFGFLTDRLGCKRVIILGLTLYALGSLLFASSSRFALFVALLGLAGCGISIFKVGALALIGGITRSSREHTALMNTVEGFFGIGAIIGPAIVATLITAGVSWKWLYVIAAVICAALIVIASLVRYPRAGRDASGPINWRATWLMLRDPYALGFSALIMLYVAVEVAIYVWMPTYLRGYRGAPAWLAVYALSIFFALRAAGRFMAVWLLARFEWSAVLALFALAIFACFAGALIGGVQVGVFSLPASGLFMSMMYPTLNSKAISCFAKAAHGAIAGVVLFFTALAAALGPLAMAALSDAQGDVGYGFLFATILAFLLLAGLVFNWWRAPAQERLSAADQADYA